MATRRHAREVERDDRAESNRSEPVTEEQLDETLEESFPASDPPQSWAGPSTAEPSAEQQRPRAAPATGTSRPRRRR